MIGSAYDLVLDSCGAGMSWRCACGRRHRLSSMSRCADQVCENRVQNPSQRVMKKHSVSNQNPYQIRNFFFWYKEVLVSHWPLGVECFLCSTFLVVKWNKIVLLLGKLGLVLAVSSSAAAATTDAPAAPPQLIMLGRAPQDQTSFARALAIRVLIFTFF